MLFNFLYITGGAIAAHAIITLARHLNETPVYKVSNIKIVKHPYSSKSRARDVKQVINNHY